MQGAMGDHWSVKAPVVKSSIKELAPGTENTASAHDTARPSPPTASGDPNPIRPHERPATHARITAGDPACRAGPMPHHRMIAIGARRAHRRGTLRGQAQAQGQAVPFHRVAEAVHPRTAEPEAEG